MALRGLPSLRLTLGAEPQSAEATEEMASNPTGGNFAETSLTSSAVVFHLDAVNVRIRCHDFHTHRYLLRQAHWSESPGGHCR